MASVVLLVGMSVMAYGADPTSSPTPTQVPPPVLSGQAELSYAGATGNTENSTLGMSGGVVVQPISCGPKGEIHLYKIGVQVGYIHTSNEHLTTSEEVDASVRIERTIHEGLRGYAAEVYYRDPFSGFENQYATEFGAVYRVLKSAEVSLELSGALGPTREERGNGARRTFLTATNGVKGTYEHDWLTLEEVTGYTHDFSDTANWRLKSSVEMTFILSRKSHQLIGVTVSYWRDQKGSPDPGKRAVGTYLTAGLKFEFPGKARTK